MTQVYKPPAILLIPDDPSEKKPFHEALVSAMQRTGVETIDLTTASRLQISADVVSMLAARGVRWAVNFVRDTLDGKPAQEIVGEINSKITVEKKINLGGLTSEQLLQLESLARTIQQGPALPAPSGDREGEV